MAEGTSAWIGLVVAVGLVLVAWLFLPNGPNRIIWRSSVILSIVSCYLMWAITFLAQLHPLIAPKRSDLRAEYLHS
jgi:V-type H+-transporting ATPase subunit e